MQDNQLSISPAGKDKPLKRVLDAGCGTGIWTVDFGTPKTPSQKNSKEGG
jgi:hypothetical protein